MKKNIFLSFRPEYFRPILYGIKKYEYRKRFCKESVTAYLYLSLPVQEVIGIVEFGKPLITEELLPLYSKNPIVSRRLIRCLDSGEHYIIPIESLQLFENPIPIQELKKINSKFFVPQCYCNIERQKDVFEYLQSRRLMTKEFKNDHSKIFESNLGVLCSEMEETQEYKDKDFIFRKKTRYKNIKCPSLTRKE